MASSIDRNSFWFEIGKTLIAAILATIGAAWTARGILADYDRRLSVVEARQQYDGQTLSEIRSDVREVRAMLASRGNQP